MECETPSAEQAAKSAPIPPTQPATDTIGQDTRNCRRILGNLLEIGDEMAGILLSQIRTQQDDPEAAQKTVASFATLSQSVRRTIMLREKLGRPARPRRDRVLARRKIIRDVEDAIESNAPADEQEKLHAEFLERLERPEMEEDIAERPIGDIVSEVTRDLGLAGLYDGHPWKRRIPHDIAILNERAAQCPGAGPSEKLLALLASAPPRPPRRTAERGPPLNIATMSDEDIERRLKILGHFREPLGR